MKRSSALRLYVATVCLTSLPLTGWMVTGSASHLDDVPWPLVAALATMLAGWQLWGPVRRNRRKSDVMQTLADTFTLTLMAVAPPGIAFLALALPSAVESVKDKAAWYKICFNTAQYGLIVASARAVFSWTSGDPFFGSPDAGPRHLWPLIAMGLTYCVLNELLLQPAVALANNEPLRAALAMAARTVTFNRVVDISLSLLALAATTLFGPAALALLLPSVVALWRKTQMAAEREHAAWRDPLTGLPNLQLLQRLYLEQRRESAEQDAGIAVLLVGLDRFDGINEALGHQAADVLLSEVGRRLQENVREGDVVARRGGDVFAVLAPASGCDPAGNLPALAGRLLQCLREPFFLSGVRVDIQATIGAATSTTVDQTAEDLLGEAGAALRVAKATARGSLRLYQIGDDKSSPAQLSMLGDLRAGIDNGELEVHYQPKVDLASGQVQAVEALVRWRRQGRLIAPDKFIPLAEETGLIAPVTWKVLDTALSQAAAWSNAGRSVSVAVNLAASQLMDTQTPAKVLAALSEHGVPATLLILEVTEGTIVRDEGKAGAVLRQLRHFGVRIAIDDYGTGYSSLSYLQRLTVDELKIDRSFIEHLAQPDNVNDRAIVGSTIALAKKLGLTVVAEGAEDQATVDVLAALGCDLVQGFHYTRPLPAAELSAWLDAHVPACRALDLA